MKNFVVDNSLKNLGKAVLWQYDRAVRLLSIMKHMQVLFFCSIEQFWAKWMERVLSIDSCSEFGCIVWSALLGVPRPSVEGSDGTLHQIAPSVYRRLLKGKYYLANATPSAESIQGYLEIVFGVPGRNAYSDWVVSQCEYGWSTNVDELNNAQGERLEFRINHAYDKGDIFEYYKSVEKANEPGECEIVKQNYLVKDNITENENRSFEAVAPKLQETDEDADFANENEMILLKLYDPNGICRKISGAPNDALSITAEYVVGLTVVSATVTRKRRSGVSVIDDGDMAMHYEKSEYFSEMHKDQQALFEQRQDDICPYPLGIKSNEPVEEIVFGFEGQQTDLYEPNRAYEVGSVFGHMDEYDRNAFNWECVEPISAVENISFEAIKHKLKKTKKGDPIVGNLVGESEDNGSIKEPRIGYYPTVRDMRVSSPVVSREQWPSLSIFYPPGTIVTPGGWPVDYFLASSAFPSSYLLGRVGKMEYVYKIPEVSNPTQTSVTDGSSFAAYFGDASGGQGSWNPYFFVTTKEIADRFKTAVKNEMDWNTTNIETAIWSWERSVGVRDELQETDYGEKFGIKDAIGKAAKMFGWTPIPLETFYDKLPKTSLICNSTLQRIRQGVSR